MTDGWEADLKKGGGGRCKEEKTREQAEREDKWTERDKGNTGRQTSDRWWVQFQTTAIKHKFFGFPMHRKVTFTPYCSLFSVQ